jgi:hypothetical protein
VAQVIQKLTAAAGQKLGLTDIQEIGIAGFTLFAQVSSQVEFSSSVPVYPLEDGSFASDHIINNPTPLKIEGVVADTFERFNPVLEQYKRIQAEIGSVSKYLPGRTTAQLSRVAGFANDIADITRKIDTAVADGQQAADFFGDQSGSQTLRQQFYRTMKDLHDSKTLISIQGTYQIFENYRITSLTIAEDNETDDITFSLTAQEIRFAEIVFADVTEFFKKPSPGNQGVTDGVKDKGKQAGTEVDSSLLASITGRSN